MSGHSQNLFGTGIYTVPEASRLSGVSVGRIRRWLRGYKFFTKSKQEHRSPALWHGQLEPIENHLALGFLDLIEIRFVDSFLKVGVTWRMLRKVHERGSEMFKTNHPFCTQKFLTDGRSIFVALSEESESSLLEIANNQHVFAKIVEPFIRDLEFRGGLPIWRPHTSKRLIVLDPARNFGRPIVAKNGIPTEVLARAASACDSIPEVSRWYGVPSDDIEDAVEFEQMLAA